MLGMNPQFPGRPASSQKLKWATRRKTFDTFLTGRCLVTLPYDLSKLIIRKRITMWHQQNGQKSVFIIHTDCVLCSLGTHLCIKFRQILSPRKAGFDPRPTPMRFVTDKVTHVGFVSESSSFWQCSIPEGKIVEAWEHSKKQCCFGNSSALFRKALSSFFRLQLYK